MTDKEIKCSGCGKPLNYVKWYTIYNKEIYCLDCYFDMLDRQEKLDRLLKRKQTKNKLEIITIALMFLAMIVLLVHNTIR